MDDTQKVLEAFQQALKDKPEISITISIDEEYDFKIRCLFTKKIAGKDYVVCDFLEHFDLDVAAFAEAVKLAFERAEGKTE